MISTRDIESRKFNLETKLARAEFEFTKDGPRARKAEREQMVAEMASLRLERDEAIAPLLKTSKAMRSARMKTERLLKSQLEAENQAEQQLNEIAGQFDSRIAEIERLLQY